MSAVALKKALDKWLFGERFDLRSPLSQAECKQRIAEYNPEVTLSVTTDFSASVFGNRIVVGMQLDRSTQFLRRTPSLVGKMRPAGNGTEIVGRSGGDLITLCASIGMEALLLLYLLPLAREEPTVLLVLLLPLFLFILTRRSTDGEELTDFLRELLEAEEILAKSGDPVVHA